MFKDTKKRLTMHTIDGIRKICTFHATKHNDDVFFCIGEGPEGKCGT